MYSYIYCYNSLSFQNILMLTNQSGNAVTRPTWTPRGQSSFDVRTHNLLVHTATLRQLIVKLHLSTQKTNMYNHTSELNTYVSLKLLHYQFIHPNGLIVPTVWLKQNTRLNLIGYNN